MLAALAALVWVPLNGGQSSHILQILSKALNDINEMPNNSERNALQCNGCVGWKKSDRFSSLIGYFCSKKARITINIDCLGHKKSKDGDTVIFGYTLSF